MLSFEQYLLEANLGGNSRSKGTSNWEAYVTDLSVDYEIEKDDNIVDETGKEISTITKGAKVKILSKDPKTIKKGLYANIDFNGSKGYVKITSIRKPGKSKNTKELTPDSIGLAGDKYDMNTLMKKIETFAQTLPPHFKDYILDICGTIVNKNLFEKEDRFTKEIKLNKVHDLDPKTELNVMSKNFGEIIAGLFLLKTSKRSKFIEYPKAQNEPLCDFWSIDQTGEKTFYSVKSGGGSSTDMKNLNKFLPYIDLNSNSPEVKKLFLILGNADKKQKTVDTIIQYMTIDNEEQVITKKICDTLGISDISLKSLSESWSKLKSGKVKMENLYKVYEMIGYTLDDKTKGTVNEIFSKDKDISNGGYLLFPLGSYIIKRLNSSATMLKLLNDILNLSSISNGVLQATVDCFNDKVVIKIIRFSNNKFKFSYNAGMKYPGNRPLGFMEA